MTAVRLGWRNLWRNRRRTWVTLSGLAAYTAVLITSLSLMDGLIGQTLRDVTDLITGDAQIHAKEYRKTRSFYEDIPQPSALLASLEKSGWRAAPRSFGFGLAAVGGKSAGALFYGVDPARERRTFRLPQQVREGRYLSAGPDREAVIGRKLARSLGAQAGSELVAVVQAADGSLGNEIFHVVGVLQPVGDDIDRGSVMLHERDFAALFASGGRVHEIALRAPDGAGLALPKVSGLAVESWKEILPVLSDMVNLNRGAVWLFVLIFFLAAGLGVTNTMLMATHDRVREYGVLKALGATPWRIVRDVAAEALVLGGLGALLGCAVGIPGTLYLEHVGIDVSRLQGGHISFGGVVFNQLWKASLSGEVVARSVLVIWAVCVLASLYPAVKVARLDPAAAMTDV